MSKNRHKLRVFTRPGPGQRSVCLEEMRGLTAKQLCEEAAKALKAPIAGIETSTDDAEYSPATGPDKD